MIKLLLSFIFNHTPLFYWTQSLWRDEAFSVWIARDSLSEVITRTSGDFNPPLYYLLLNIWLHLFGSSEVILRGFSVACFIGLLFVIYRFAYLFFKSRNAATTTTLLMALNPMLLYFAFELRMYSLLTLFTALSWYFLYQKRFWPHVVVTVLGLYTQPYMLFVLLSQNVFLLTKQKLKLIIVTNMCIAALFLPWVPTLLLQLKASGPMWMYPVDWQLVTSVLGNLFMGYEGTPGNLWIFMQCLSLGFVLMFMFLWRKKKLRSRLSLIGAWIMVPVVLIVGVSFIKPLYVHRYLIYVVIGETLLLSLFLTELKTNLKRVTTTVVVLTLVFFNLYAVSFHRKVPIRDTFAQINSQLQPNDVVYAQTPLVYYESLYYTQKSTQVYLYNPEAILPPRYVGSVGMPQSTWAHTYPTYPNRAFVVSESGSYIIASL